MTLGRRRLVAGAGAAVVVVLAVAYLWPAITRSPDRVDALLAGDGQLSSSAFDLGRRLRERGVSVDDELLTGGTCDGAAALAARRADLDPATVVVSYRTAPEAGCPFAGDAEGFLGALVDAAGDAEFVVVFQPPPGGQDEDMATAVRDLADEAGVTLVDLSGLLVTDDGGISAPCQWWDDCPPEGFVTIRDEAGSLTSAGRERVARAVAAAIP